MSCSERNRFPFTVSQWQELEHQALVFKYMVSGIPIPPDLIFTVRRSLGSSLSSKLLLHQSQLGWNGFDMAGFGMRKIDAEPGRCRRTDGKKWRCSKDAYPDSKYCERHMHRGRNRSRKPVEDILSPSKSAIIPIITKNRLYSPLEPRFLYSPNLSSTRPPGLIGLSSPQENTTTTKCFLEFNDYTHLPDKAYRKRHGDEIKRETNHEHTFCSVNDSSSSWQLGFSLSQLEDSKAYSSSSSGLRNGRQQNHEHHYNIERDNNDEPKKVMHHFLDEWSLKDKSDSWHFNSEDKLSIINRNNTQLSMSTPNSLHDFFMTQK